MPSCEAVRPARCPCCRVESRPIGSRVVVVGHGVVERQVLGPAAARGVPMLQLLRVRRYRCRSCTAVLLVGPRGLVPGRWYGAGAIGVALTRFALGETHAAVRGAVSPLRWQGVAATERWVTLSRWIDAVEAGRLLGIRVPAGLGRRGVAEHAARVLAARADGLLQADRLAAAFEGASAAA